MGDVGNVGCRIIFFLFAVTVLANITMVAVTRDNRGSSPSSSGSGKRSLRHKITNGKQGSEDDLSSPIVSKRPESVSDEENSSSTEVDGLDSWSQKQQIFILEDVYKVWDSKVGCGKFREKIQDYEHRNSSFRSLQPDHLTCAELKQQHATVLVKSSTWIPDSLNGFYYCSCGLTCLWTKSEVLGYDADVHFYEGAGPPSVVSIHLPDPAA